MMGVDSVDSSKRQKATKNSMDKGVAGRNMLARGRATGREGRWQRQCALVLSEAPKGEAYCAALGCAQTTVAVAGAGAGEGAGRVEATRRTAVVKRVTVEVGQAVLAAALRPRSLCARALARRLHAWVGRTAREVDRHGQACGGREWARVGVEAAERRWRVQTTGSQERDPGGHCTVWAANGRQPIIISSPMA